LSRANLLENTESVQFSSGIGSAEQTLTDSHGLVGRGPQLESDPHKIKVTLELQRNSRNGEVFGKAQDSLDFGAKPAPTGPNPEALPAGGGPVGLSPNRGRDAGASRR
jgi:hypothetical protein